MKATILRPSPENLQILAQAIQSGDVVGMPTETVYGLAGNCFNPVAVTRIFEAKERPTFDPLIVHAVPQSQKQNDRSPFSLEDLEHQGILDTTSPIFTKFRDPIQKLIQTFWPGPLTLVLPKGSKIPDLVTSGLPTVAVRMPEHPLAQALIRQAGCPLAAPSANRFGRISPTTAQAVADELGDRIRWILDGGQCPVGVESTILAVQEEGFQILRAGGTPPERIEEVLQCPLRSSGERETPPSSHFPGHSPGHSPGVAQAPQIAPGLLESHYAPSKPFILLKKSFSQMTDLEITQWADRIRPAMARAVGRSLGILLFSGDPEAIASRLSSLLQTPVLVKSLSRTGDLREAAQRLFLEMRELDASNASILFAEPCTQLQGLGYAIQDRLKRASAKSRYWS